MQTFDMMLFTYINENIDRVKKDIKAGIIPCSLLFHWEIYARYDALKKMGNSDIMARYNTSDQFDICERTMLRVIKKMETNI